MGDRNQVLFFLRDRDPFSAMFRAPGPHLSLTPLSALILRSSSLVKTAMEKLSIAVRKQQV
jgi:hypothetical protein